MLDNVICNVSVVFVACFKRVSRTTSIPVVHPGDVQLVQVAFQQALPSFPAALLVARCRFRRLQPQGLVRDSVLKFSCPTLTALILFSSLPSTSFFTALTFLIPLNLIIMETSGQRYVMLYFLYTFILENPNDI